LDFLDLVEAGMTVTRTGFCDPSEAGAPRSSVAVGSSPLSWQRSRRRPPFRPRPRPGTPASPARRCSNSGRSARRPCLRTRYSGRSGGRCRWMRRVRIARSYRPAAWPYGDRRACRWGASPCSRPIASRADHSALPSVPGRPGSESAALHNGAAGGAEGVAPSCRDADIGIKSRQGPWV
jgi:hypothetical protein